LLPLFRQYADLRYFTLFAVVTLLVMIGDFMIQRQWKSLSFAGWRIARVKRLAMMFWWVSNHLWVYAEGMEKAAEHRQERMREIRADHLRRSVAQ
jgi:hypothetical protein